MTLQEDSISPGASSPHDQRIIPNEFHGRRQERRQVPIVKTLFMILAIVIGIGAGTFGILLLADPPRFCYYNPYAYYDNYPKTTTTTSRYDYNNPCHRYGGYRYSYFMNGWSSEWLVNLIAITCMTLLDVLIAALLLFLTFTRPQFKLPMIANNLLIVFNLFVVAVGGWLLTALLIERKIRKRKICFGGYDCDRYMFVILATALTLALPLVFIPVFLKWRCCPFTLDIRMKRGK